jgi:hypothetical protein
MAKRQKNRQHNDQKTEEQTTQWPKDEEQTTQWPKERALSLRLSLIAYFSIVPSAFSNYVFIATFEEIWLI